VDHSSAMTNEPSGDGRVGETAELDTDIDGDIDEVFDRPALWRFEAVAALGIDDADLPAAMSPGPTFPAALRSAVAALPDDIAHVVDLGAGAGGASEWVRLATGAEVHAVEPAPRARLAAQLLFPEIHVVDGSAAWAPLDGGCADLVTMLGVVSLLDDLTPALTEAARLLGGRGHLVIADLVSASATSWSDADNRFRSVEDLEATVHAHGFVVDTVGCGAVAASGRWGEVAERVDRWIESNCVDRPGYQRWWADKDKLRALARDGQVLGGVLVAHPSSQRMSVLARTSVEHGARVRTRHAWSAGAGPAGEPGGSCRAGAEVARSAGGRDGEIRDEQTGRGRHE
jgi:SAM-dependent methyltransferase